MVAQYLHLDSEQITDKRPMRLLQCVYRSNSPQSHIVTIVVLAKKGLYGMFIDINALLEL